jgi:hypothetical protein
MTPKATPASPHPAPAREGPRLKQVLGDIRARAGRRHHSRILAAIDLSSRACGPVVPCRHRFASSQSEPSDFRQHLS